MKRLVLVGCVAVIVALGVGYALVRGWTWLRPGAPAGTAGVPVAPGTADDTRKIRSTLFYVAEDGLRLTGVDREVPFGEGIVAQARLLVAEQLKPAPVPLAQAIPAGTTLRTIFVTDRGDAFVDLSRDVTSGHTGGSLDEIFSIYAIVNTLTVNLPAISRVQILVEGKQVDTLAGHVDLRQPLQKNLFWLQAPAPPPADTPPATPPATAPPTPPAPGRPTATS